MGEPRRAQGAERRGWPPGVGALRARPRPLRPRPSRVPARTPGSALAAEPPLPPDEWSRLLPGRDPAPPGAPAPSGEGAGPGEGADPGAAGELAAGGRGRGAPARRAQPGAHGAATAGTAAGNFGWWWAGEGAGARAALGRGREGGRQAGGRDAHGAARAEGTDLGSRARPPVAGQRGREARAFCPGFSGGAPAAVSSARVFVFRWRGPGTAGARGSGGGGSRSGMSLATGAGHPPPRATLAPYRAGPHAELRGAGSAAPLAPGTGIPLPSLCPLGLAVGGSGRGVPGPLLSAGLLCLDSFIYQLLKLGMGQQGPPGPFGASPLPPSLAALGLLEYPNTHHPPSQVEGLGTVRPALSQFGRVS